MNFLEQLVSEWYEFEGFFVRRNVKVGRRAKGGYEGELDVVAFHPKKIELVHIEASTDSDTWEKRELRFSKKFELGRKYIPSLFDGFELPPPRQIAVLVYGSNVNRKTIGGGEIKLASVFMNELKSSLKEYKIASHAIPEGFPLLRTLQFAASYWK
jgi:hypothetical protein